MKRHRFLYFVLVCLVVPLGLGSRRYAETLPDFVARYAGDTLWSVMVFLVIAFVARKWPTLRVATATLAVSYSVEVSQLFHAPWIDAVRHTTLGGLALGEGFLWSDLACYTTGVAFCAAVERLSFSPSRRTRETRPR